MEFDEVIKARESIRHYSRAKVSAASIARILKAVETAPSGNNAQPTRIVVVQSPTMRKRIEQRFHQAFMKDAERKPPVLIVFHGDPQAYAEADKNQNLADNPELSQNYRQRTIRDLAVALSHAHLAAVNEGLGSCIVSLIDHKGLKRDLGIPEDHEIVGVLALGHAHPDARAANRGAGWRAKRPIAERTRYV